LSRLAAWAVRHARAVLAVSAVLALGAGAAATQLPTDAGTETLVDTDTASYRATEEVRQAFGEEPVVVLAEGDLQELVLTENLGRLLRLEGCLSGEVPKGADPIPGPCAELARQDPVRSLIGPATFLNEATIQIERQLRRLVETVPPERLRDLLLSLAAEYGITSTPSLGNPDFLAALIFDLRRSRGTPKARLSYIFPNSRSTQIVIRLRPGLSEHERREAIETIRAAVYDDTPRAACRFRGEPEPCFQLRGGRYLISGAPVVIDAVTPALKDALLLLLAVAAIVMALTLIAVFRSRLRLLPLALALASAALTFGLFHLAGGALTLASIAVLPILIGLAVDYAIQLQARYDEAVASGLRRAEAAARAASSGGPTIAIACLATVAGFLALQLSPTPMVRGFGLLLVVGVAIAFAVAFLAGFAGLSLRREVDGALVVDSPTKAPGAVDLALRHPRRVLGVGLALAVLGWGLGTRVDTQSDIVELAPQDVEAVQDLKRLQEITGVSGELDVSVEADDLTDPAAIRWMAGFKRRALATGGFAGESPSCREAEICPGPALSDFVTGGGLAVGGGRDLTRREIRAAFGQIPAYDLRPLATLDPETGLPAGRALLGFGIRAGSLADQQALIDRVRAEIGVPGEPGGPPAGVEVRLAGLPVIAAAAASDLSESRYLLTAAGLLAVALVLLAAYRSPPRALVPLAPIVLATGWAALVLWLSGIPLNPMSAALGALTIAIATEFSVILSGRFHEERRRGRPVAEALRTAYARTGAAVLASGATATAGFAVLVASDVKMLRDFGLVTVIDLAVALLGVMLVLPAALAWAEARRGEGEG
jgi:predicted RND superfamily exporter protein